MGSRVAGVVLSVALSAMLIAVPAQATFRGANGKIAYTFEKQDTLDVAIINPDGTEWALLTGDPARDSGPRWSPDGAKIAFNTDRDGSWDIYVMDPDGSDQTALTTDPARDFGPVWSPDGTKIVFSSDRDGDGGGELWVMDADGSNEAMITDGPGSDGGPSWSPDSSQLVFTRSDWAGSPADPDNIYRVDVDGSNLTPLTAESEHTQDRVPLWSPDGSTIAFQYRPSDGGDDIWTMSPDGSGKDFIYVHSWSLALREWAPAGGKLLLSPASTMNPDGTDVRYLSANHQTPPGSSSFYYFQGEIWSPDAQYVAGIRILCFDEDIPCRAPKLFIMDAAGNELVELFRARNPDWQPLPVNAYVRPKSAHPVDVSLVPAYRECAGDSRNRVHGHPLAYYSCAPPVRMPGQLTVGTPDANGQPAKSTGRIIMNTLVGNPATPADEADIRLRATITDVRLVSDLSDYTGGLGARMSLRITDKDNAPEPGAATVQDATYSFPIPCAATADATIGSTCAVDTTAEALVPGIAKERARAVWELGQVEVLDGGGDVFMRQGIFVP